MKTGGGGKIRALYTPELDSSCFCLGSHDHGLFHALFSILRRCHHSSVLHRIYCRRSLMSYPAVHSVVALGGTEIYDLTLDCGKVIDCCSFHFFALLSMCSIRVRTRILSGARKNLSHSSRNSYRTFFIYPHLKKEICHLVS
jgi:hypothetical protein